MSSRHTWLLLPLLLAAILLACSEDQPTDPSDKRNDTTDQDTTQFIDTTSHDITWEIHRLGRPGMDGSIIRDIYALNDTDVWAVGKFQIEGKPDSTGFTQTIFNAAHWNGKEWTIQNLNVDRYSKGAKGAGLRRFVELYCIWAFGHNDLVAVDATGKIQWYDENSTKYGYELYEGKWGTLTYWDEEFTSGSRRGGIRKIFAYDKDNIYFCGTNGSLTHYDGVDYRLIETQTFVPLNDVYGSADGRIWAGGYDVTTNGRSFVRIENGVAAIVDVTDAHGHQACGHSVYISSDSLFAYVYDAIIIQSVHDQSHLRYTARAEEFRFLGFIESLRGKSHNDVYAAGHFGTIIHWNGKSWAVVAEQPSYEMKTSFRAMALTEQYIFIAGKDYGTGEAVIAVGRVR